MEALLLDRPDEPLGIEDQGAPGGRDSPPGDSRIDSVSQADPASMTRLMKGLDERHRQVRGWHSAGRL